MIPEKLEFVFQLLVPLAFLPLVGFELTALAIPTLAYSLLSQFSAQYSIRYFYFAPMLPFLFFAMILGLQRIQNLFLRLNTPPLAARAFLMSLVFTASIGVYYFQSPAPLGRYFQPERYTIDAHTQFGDQLMRSVPQDATVATLFDLMAHLSGRRLIYEIPWLPDYRQADYLVVDVTRGWYKVHRGYWEQLLATGYFETTVDHNGYLVARRKPLAILREIRFGDELTFLGYGFPSSDLTRGGTLLRPFVSWRGDKAIRESYWMRIRLVDTWGHVWAERDGAPQDGMYPTTRWQAGKSVGDQYVLTLPPTMPAGDYQITLGS